MAAETVQVDGRRIRLTNLGKVLYPATGFTKADLIDYYVRVAPLMLPHLRGRPVTLKRYPNGVNQPFFFEKNCPSHRPDWLPTATVRYSAKRTIKHCLIEERAALAWLGNLAAIELHTSLARAEAIEQPTMIVFDLDPGADVGLAACAGVAMALHDALAELGWRTAVKASGGKGLHVALPLNTAVTYGESRPFAHAMARLVERRLPGRVTTKMSKAERPGRVFIDWSQNALHKTTACAYTMRATTSPAVSMPLDWKEVAQLAAGRNRGGDLTAPSRALHAAARGVDKYIGASRWRQRLDEKEKIAGRRLV